MKKLHFSCSHCKTTVGIRAALKPIGKKLRCKQCTPKTLCLHIPERLSQICMKALRKDKNQRYQQVSEFVHELQQVSLLKE